MADGRGFGARAGRSAGGGRRARAPGGFGLAGRAEITLRKLRAFWAIAHSDSLTRAAKTLGIAQPSLSQQLTSLEAALGAKLFERRSNRMDLTEAVSGPTCCASRSTCCAASRS